MFLKIANLEVPNAIIILEDSLHFDIQKNEHYVFKVSDGMFFITHVNGKEYPTGHLVYHEYDIHDMFFSGKTKYQECSLESFNNLKIFL